MFNLFKKKDIRGEVTKFKVEGMHCVSCAMSIDCMLEDADGIKSSQTNYAKAETEVVFEIDKIKTNRIINLIEKQGYSAKLLN